MAFRSISLFFVALASMQSIHADDIILMESFEPLKVVGKWFVWKRSTHLTEQTSNSRCIQVDIEHDEKSGNLYNMALEWIDPSDGKLSVSFAIIDDTSHPARYFFQSDQHKIALSVLGTDYNNWVVAYGMLGSKDAYFVATRKLPLDNAFMNDVEAIISKNQVTRSLAVIEHSSC